MQDISIENKKLSTLLFAISIFCCFLFFSGPVKAQPQVSFSPLIQNLSLPLDLKNAGDGSGRLFIAEQAGKIKIYKNGALLSKPFLDITSIVSIVGNEQGLLSIAFHPKYKKNRTFFVLYTGLNNNIILASYKVSKTDPDSAEATGTILISLPKEGGSLGRNGGNLHFGNDKLLYVSFGDGGTGSNNFGNPQDGQVFFGKILRIKTNAKVAPYYSIPADNPFTSDPNVLDEIWALGLRQPWRWSFDRLTGDMWMGDVGQSKREEINFRSAAQSAGTNYGWPCYEGDTAYKLQGCGISSNYSFPIFSYKNNATDGGSTVIGGFVYRGTAYPAMQGYYLCADNGTHNLWKINSNGAGGWNVFSQPGAAPIDIVSFGEGEDAELYAVSIDGTVYQVQATALEAIYGEGSSKNNVQNHIDLRSTVFPTLVSNSIITLELKEPYSAMRLIDISGREVMRKTLDNFLGRVVINLPALKTGMYVVQLLGSHDLQKKIYITK